MKLSLYIFEDPTLFGLKDPRSNILTIVLIHLLFIGIVLGSPLPDLEDRSVSSINDGAETEETKSQLQLHTIPFAPPEPDERGRDLPANPSHEVEDLEPISITSPTMFNQGFQQKRTTTGQFTQRKLETGNIKDQTIENSKNIEASNQKKVHVTSEVRTVSFRINKKSPIDTALPPLVFAQQPPELSLEPTEVEAPGTTPTTLSMVTESVPSITSHNSPITFIEQSFSTEANTELVHDLKSRVVIIESKDIKPKSSFTLEQKISDLKEPSVTPGSNSRTEKSFDDFPQKDDPRTLMLESYPTLGRTSSTFVKGDTITEFYNREEINPPTAFVLSDSAVHNQKHNTSDITKQADKINSTSITERSVLDHLLLEVINHDDENINSESTAPNTNSSNTNSSLKLQQEHNLESTNKTFVDKQIDVKNINSEKPIVLELRPVMDRNHTLKVDDFAANATASQKNVESDHIAKEHSTSESPKSEELSVIETREADEDSFFSSLNSPEERKSRVYIEDNGQVNTNQSIPKKTGYVSTVYTSSSEIDYRNFNPEFNASNRTSSSNFAKTKNMTSLEKNIAPDFKIGESRMKETENRPLEQPHISHVKITYNDMVPEEKEIDDDSYATSFPSQTSIVNPIEDNASGSSLRQETLPSLGHITKTPHDAKSHNFPKVLDSSSHEPISLEAYPNQPSLSPPVKKERISVTISEHDEPMTAGCVAGIVLGILLTLAFAAGGATYYLYNRQTGIRPKVLSSDRSCANSDSGGYLDDQCRVAYVNSQVDISKGTPEDLVSLDNDSFLNSLESMTIQNLWTDSIRHTKL